MYSGKLVFAQVMDHLPPRSFRRGVSRYDGDYKVRSFSCLDQYRCMAFAQLTFRESLRDIETCLRAQSNKLYHMGIRGAVSRSTLADANERRDWRIYRDVALALIHIARRLYQKDSFGVDLENTVYALDSTTINLCLSLFPWARYKHSAGAVKLHTLLDLRGPIPSIIRVTDGKTHDVSMLDQFVPEPGAFYIMDRGYLDFARLYRIHLGAAFFVIRSRKNIKYSRRSSIEVNKDQGFTCDQTVRLNGAYTGDTYPCLIRRVRVRDPESGGIVILFTNNFDLPTETIAELYRCRWKIELFFKWIKQHLRIKAFFGTSENAVKTQIWIAVSVYVLVAIIKKRLNIDASLYTILQIISVTAFERTPLNQLLTQTDLAADDPLFHNQLNLFT